MSGISAYARKAMLDWVLGGAAPTRPTAWGLGLSLGTPSSTAGSEMSVAGYLRQNFTFGAAASPGGSAFNTVAATFLVNSACTIKGWGLWDTVLSSNSGNLLAFGQLSASSVMASGDLLAFSISACKISLA